MPHENMPSERPADDGIAKLTVEQRLNCLLLLARGYTREAMCERFGISKKGISKLLQQHNVRLLRT